MSAVFLPARSVDVYQCLVVISSRSDLVVINFSSTVAASLTFYMKLNAAFGYSIQIRKVRCEM